MVTKRISTMNMSELKKERKVIDIKLDEPKRKVFSKSTQTLLKHDKEILIRMSKLKEK